MSWAEFKEFLQKNLGDSRAFVDSIWKKVKRDSQYQDKMIQNWAAYLEYLQSILIEFDPECAPEEGTMIWYFREGLRPSVRVKMEQRGRELNSFEELVEKTVDVEAKAALRLRSYARKTNQYCLWGNRPSAAKASTQGQPMKDSRVEEPKSRPQKSKAPVSQHSDSAETSEKAQKKKKKNDHQNKRDCRARKGSIPATGVNTTDAENSKKKRNGSNYRNPSKVVCYNCNKKGHYSNKCPKPPKSKN